MTKAKRTPEEQRILDRLRKSGPIEATEELCLEQARAMGLLPQPDLQSPETLEPVTDEYINELSEELFSLERMSQ